MVHDCMSSSSHMDELSAAERALSCVAVKPQLTTVQLMCGVQVVLEWDKLMGCLGDRTTRFLQPLLLG